MLSSFYSLTKIRLIRKVSLFKKSKTKDFAWIKYGKEEAFKLACEWRDKEIVAMQSEGVFYHESHGKEKGVTMKEVNAYG